MKSIILVLFEALKLKFTSKTNIEDLVTALELAKDEFPDFVRKFADTMVRGYEDGINRSNSESDLPSFIKEEALALSYKNPIIQRLKNLSKCE